METKTKWYQRMSFIIALLVFFFPVGLVLMWKYTNWSKKTKWIVTGIVIFIFFSIGSSSSSKPNTTTEAQRASNKPERIEPTKTPVKKEPTKVQPKDHELDAIVKFNEQAFLITNNEADDWNNCKFELNSGILRGGYTYKQATLTAKDAVIIPFSEFTKRDGTRFNAYSTKPQNVSISCDVKHTHGFNYFTIN